MSFKLEGKIKEVKNVRQVSEKFRVREFVITDSSTMYPQDILVQLANDKCEIIDNFAVGSDVTVSFNLKGRGWNKEGESETRYFNTIEGWKIEATSGQAPQGNAQPQAQAQNAQPQAQVQPQGSTVSSTPDDDLPF